MKLIDQAASRRPSQPTRSETNARFQLGSGVFKCRLCDHRTRDTGEDNTSLELCVPCFDLSSDDNAANDSANSYEFDDNQIDRIKRHAKVLSQRGLNLDSNFPYLLSHPAIAALHLTNPLTTTPKETSTMNDNTTLVDHANAATDSVNIAAPEGTPNIDLETASVGELLGFYNEHALTLDWDPVKRFADRASAVRRVQALIENLARPSVAPEKIERAGKGPKEPKAPAKSKEERAMERAIAREAKAEARAAEKAARPPTDRGAAVAETWKNPEVAAARAIHDKVRVDGVDYRSTRAAWNALNLRPSHCIPFRIKLKASKAEEYEGHQFEIVPATPKAEKAPKSPKAQKAPKVAVEAPEAAEA